MSQAEGRTFHHLENPVHSSLHSSHCKSILLVWIQRDGGEERELVVRAPLRTTGSPERKCRKLICAFKGHPNARWEGARPEETDHDIL